jgi:hypothetical protein
LSQTEVSYLYCSAPVEVKAAPRQKAIHYLHMRQWLRWSRGLHAGLWYPRSWVHSWLKSSDFFSWKNPQHAFLRRES